MEDRTHRSKVMEHKAGQGFLLPWLALAFLIGITLVSLVGTIGSPGDGAEPIPAPLPEGDGVILVVAPGDEHRIPQSERLLEWRFHPPYEHLPEIGDGYWVLTPTGRPLARLPDEWSITSQQDHDGWRLVRIDPQQASAGAQPFQIDLANRLQHARVFFRAPDGRETPCDLWRFGRWGCGLDEWLWVGLTELEMRRLARSCIWAHPRAGHELVIRFANLPRGTRLSGRFGLSDSAVAVPDGGPVDLMVRAGSQEQHWVAENREGFFPYHLSLDDRESGVVDVEYIVTAENDGRRHFCFTASMQGIGPMASDGSLPPDKPDEGLSPGEPGEGLSPGEPGEGLSPGEPGEGLSPGEPGEGLSPGEPGESLSPGEPGEDLSDLPGPAPQIQSVGTGDVVP